MRIGLQSVREFVLVWALLTLAACGGGGGGGSSTAGTGGTKTSQPQGATLTYPSGTQAFPVGIAITPLTPTFTDALGLFSVTPALPPGLSLNTMTGVISGTPTTVTPAGNYTISGEAYSGASASATISIAVNNAPPSQLSYGAANFSYTVGEVSSTLKPTAIGGAATSWSISATLPQGLTFSTTDGSISGTPTAAASSAPYVVTAQNAAGSNTVTLSIAVNAAPLFHLGHQSSVNSIRANPTTVFSEDNGGNWILWNYSGASIIASGNSGCVAGTINPVCPSNATWMDMAGATAVVQTATGFEFHATTDGHVLGTISTSVPAWWRLASDGSYLAAGTRNGVQAWSTSGQLLFSNSGNYAGAVAFAAPGQLLVANGAAGANVIETITVSGGLSTLGPTFNGTFSSWFVDGSQFITTVSNTALIYSNPGAQAQAQTGSITSLGGTPAGEGNWVWTLPAIDYPTYPLSFFPATGSSDGSAPVVTYTFNGPTVVATPSGSTIGVTSVGARAGTDEAVDISVIDLSGSSPVKTDYTANLEGAAFAAASASQWVVGDGRGVLVDGMTLSGTSRYFGYGEALSVAGGSGHFAVATASGSILYFNSATLALEGQIPFAASELRLSADGTLLAAVADITFTTADSVQIYSIPAGGAPLYTWPLTYVSTNGTATFVAGIELSGSGNMLIYELSTSGTFEVSAPTGGTPVLSASGAGIMSISPDGTLVASGAITGSDLWLNGTLVTAFGTESVAWLDNTRLLVNNWDTTITYTAQQPQYLGCSIYGINGAATNAPCALPTALTSIQPVTTDSIYAPPLNEIFSVSTGAVTWASADPTPIAGAVAGPNAIFPSGIDLLAQPVSTP